MENNNFSIKMKQKTIWVKIRIFKFVFDSLQKLN